MIVDVLLGFCVASIIGIQALMIATYQEKFKKVDSQLTALTKYKAEKREMKLGYKIIQGDMEMYHEGRKAKVKAIFYPKKMV